VRKKARKWRGNGWWKQFYNSIEWRKLHVASKLDIDLFATSYHHKLYKNTNTFDFCFLLKYRWLYLILKIQIRLFNKFILFHYKLIKIDNYNK
jgi:hypothetical protein